MKMEDIFTIIMNKTTDMKSLMEDFQRLTEHLSEVAKYGKSMVETIEKIKK